MRQIQIQRKPQRRATRTVECETADLFPATLSPAGANTAELDELLAAIGAVLDHCAA